MKTVTVTAKSISHALKNAATELGTEQDQLDYELISQTSAGLLSFFGGKKVEIKAWAKKSSKSTKSNRSNKSSSSRRSNTRRPSEPRADLEPMSDQQIGDLVEDLRSFCEGVCKFISPNESLSVSANLEGEKLLLNIDDDVIAQTISKNSRLAESLEHILRKKPRYLKRELPFRIFVDANELRTSRETELIDLANDLSMKVADNQRPIVLNYKSSYDRKIIHMALDKNDNVYTKSIGTGANRKLMILPVKAEGAENADHGDQRS